MSYLGGCGIDSCGRSECGNAKSDIEPRFLLSHPGDYSRNNPLSTQLKFSTYLFSSFLAKSELLVEISEDYGVNYVTAYSMSTFVAPYNGVNSKVYYEDGQVLTFQIMKTSNWLQHSKVMIRLTGEDEYGNLVSKTLPVTW